MQAFPVIFSGANGFMQVVVECESHYDSTRAIAAKLRQVYRSRILSDGRHHRVSCTPNRMVQSCFQQP